MIRVFQSNNPAMFVTRNVRKNEICTDKLNDKVQTLVNVVVCQLYVR